MIEEDACLVGEAGWVWMNVDYSKRMSTLGSSKYLFKILKQWLTPCGLAVLNCLYFSQERYCCTLMYNPLGYLVSTDQWLSAF